jgi:ATP-binding cassette, subfamily B, bacterial HlyB/CyaB
MAADTEQKANDPGLTCLVILLRVHGIAAEVEQIRHRMGSVVRITEMIRCAKELGLKARASRTTWARLAKTPLPGIASLCDGGFIVLGKMAEDQVLVQRPFSPRPELMKRAEFEAIWDGHLTREPRLHLVILMEYCDPDTRSRVFRLGRPVCAARPRSSER